MKLVKGCPNGGCRLHIKKQFFKDNVNYCSECGEKLVYVCRDCYKELADTDKPICARCQAERDAKKEQLKDGAKKASGAILGFVPLAIGTITSADKKKIAAAAVSVVGKIAGR